MYVQSDGFAKPAIIRLLMHLNLRPIGTSAYATTHELQSRQLMIYISQRSSMNSSLDDMCFSPLTSSLSLPHNMAGYLGFSNCQSEEKHQNIQCNPEAAYGSQRPTSGNRPSQSSPFQPPPAAERTCFMHSCHYLQAPTSTCPSSSRGLQGCGQSPRPSGSQASP